MAASIHLTTNCTPRRERHQVLKARSFTFDVDISQRPPEELAVTPDSLSDGVRARLISIRLCDLPRSIASTDVPLLFLSPFAPVSFGAARSKFVVRLWRNTLS